MSARHEHGEGEAHDHAHGVGITTAEHLAEHLAELLSPSAAIVCVGNDMCGDDAAGPAVAERLIERTPWALFNTQTVPESFLMKIVSGRPDRILLVDALNFDAPPGSVELFGSDQIEGQGPSTHGPAPLAFLEILQMFHSCRRAVLGIQPAKVDFGEKMTEPVAAAVEMVVQAFLRVAADSRT